MHTRIWSELKLSPDGFGIINSDESNEAFKIFNDAIELLEFRSLLRFFPRLFRIFILQIRRYVQKIPQLKKPYFNNLNYSKKTSDIKLSEARGGFNLKTISSTAIVDGY